MKQNQEKIARTYPVYKLIIFLLVVIVLSIAIAVGAIFLLDTLALQIVIYIFCGIFFVLSFVVLFKEAIVYLVADEKNKNLVIHGAILKRKIPFSLISRVDIKDGYYIFFNGKKELYRVGVERPGANSLVLCLEKNGINIKW